MMLLMQILVALGVGLVIYAVYGVFTSGSSPAHSKLKIQDPPLAAADPGKEQKIQRLQSQIAQLEGELAESKTTSSQEKSDLAALKEKETGFNTELKRREEWVAKAEAELAKIKTENVELTNRFTAKEKELEDEFTKNVNLTREVREIKAALEAKEMACRLKEDELQAQKHQLEAHTQTINEHAAKIAEYSRKEKISEWVPKSEFNQLNEEYTKLEKEFEANQERLKSFAAEIAHLRSAQENKKSQLGQEAKSTGQTKEEDKPIPGLETSAAEEAPQTQKVPPVEDASAGQDTGIKEDLPRSNPPTPVTLDLPTDSSVQNIAPEPTSKTGLENSGSSSPSQEKDIPDSQK